MDKQMPLYFLDVMKKRNGKCIKIGIKANLKILELRGHTVLERSLPEDQLKNS